MICQNCKEAEAEILTVVGMNLCNNCNESIDKEMDKLRDLYRNNQQMYGNKLGTINQREYWGK
jgi:protein-arginine kinase activator protein McsA